MSVIGRVGPRVGAARGAAEVGHCLAVTRAFLLESERVEGVPFGLPGLPFISNRSLWSEDIPRGGYLGEYHSLPRSTLVRSLDGMWSLQANRGNAKGPVLRAMTWMCCTRGLDAAVHYLFDLQRAGFISGVATVGDSLVLLTTLRGLVPRDRDLATLVFVEEPHTNRQWLETAFRNDFGVGHAPVGDYAGGVADLILQECLETMRRCREAANYDEWLVGQLNQSTLLSTALNVFKHLVPQPTLQVRVLMDMIEEVMADAETFHSKELGGPLLQPCFGLAQHVSREIAAVDPDLWKRRVLEERVVLPRALEHFLNRQDWFETVGRFEIARDLSADLPPAWRGVSPEAAYSVHLSVRGQEPSPWTPLAFPNVGADRPPDEPVDVEADWEEARRVWEAGEQEVDRARAEAIALEAQGQLRLALDTYRRILASYPWCHVLRDRMAHVRLLQQDYEGAVAEMCTAVLCKPTELGHWWSLEEVCRSAGLATAAAVAGVLRNRLAVGGPGP